MNLLKIIKNIIKTLSSCLLSIVLVIILLLLCIFLLYLVSENDYSKSHNLIITPSDYCIEDGDCDEGYIYNGRMINEEYCKELNGIWRSNSKYKNYCKLKYLPPIKNDKI